MNVFPLDRMNYAEAKMAGAFVENGPWKHKRVYVCVCVVESCAIRTKIWGCLQKCRVSRGNCAWDPKSKGDDVLRRTAHSVQR